MTAWPASVRPRLGHRRVAAVDDLRVGVRSRRARVHRVTLAGGAEDDELRPGGRPTSTGRPSRQGPAWIEQDRRREAGGEHPKADRSGSEEGRRSAALPGGSIGGRSSQRPIVMEEGARQAATNVDLSARSTPWCPPSWRRRIAIAATWAGADRGSLGVSASEGVHEVGNGRAGWAARRPLLQRPPRGVRRR